METSNLHDDDRSPRVLREPGKGEDGTWLNVDAAILMLRRIDSAKARQTYRAYLKHRRALERQGRTGQQARMDALMAAIHDMGGRLPPVDISHLLPAEPSGAGA